MTRFITILEIRPIIENGEFKGFRFIKRIIEIPEDGKNRIKKKDNHRIPIVRSPRGSRIKRGGVIRPVNRKGPIQVRIIPNNGTSIDKPIKDLKKLEKHLDNINSPLELQILAMNLGVRREDISSSFNKIKELYNSGKRNRRIFALEMLRNHYVGLDKNNNKRPIITRKIGVEKLYHPTIGVDYPYIPIILEMINKTEDDPIVSTAIAKLGGQIFETAPNIMYEFLKNNKLDRFTHNLIIHRILKLPITNEVRDKIDKLKVEI